MNREFRDVHRKAMRTATLADEAAVVKMLVEITDLDAISRRKISALAAKLVREVRESASTSIMESFLSEYGLSTKEGVALMCLAEAMLRVPDAPTIGALIKDKIRPHDWGAHLGAAGSILLNATTWGLLLTGRVLEDEADGIAGLLHGLVRRMGEPLIRKAIGEAMEEMGQQFVLGRDITEAIRRGRKMIAEGYSYSYDMLGEAARTNTDAAHYFKAYQEAISTIAAHATREDIRDNPGISVKLSALHPRYEMSQREVMLPLLRERLLVLAQMAKAAKIGINIDAEEADRLELSLDVIELTLADKSLSDWDGFGVVVQAYSRRACSVIEWLYSLAERLDRRIMVRLVKGAYWDTEIKRAQVMGLDSYPVFTRKAHTDVSYIACARKLLRMTERIYPQFATHNAHSAMAILEMAGTNLNGFEFQRLYGMGKSLHAEIKQQAGVRCRIYAPVGAHCDLLAYLVRRLLENGANSSFVNQIVDLSVAPETIAADPIDLAMAGHLTPNAMIPTPAAIFAPRQNSRGWDLTNPVDIAAIEAGRLAFAAPHRWSAAPISAGNLSVRVQRQIHNPAKPEEVVGEVCEADAKRVCVAVELAQAAQPAWQATSVVKRAEILRGIADLFEENTFEFLALATREAGKTLADGIAELREAVDFLRFYADAAVRSESGSTARGVILCISPWNFPLAIFTGQIAAALATGNAVIAKPAEQTPLIACKAVTLMRAAGVPESVIQLLPGHGATVGRALIADTRIAGVCFTGSTTVAKIIDRQLARSAADAMLIAETGGLNAMIVDSTALLEQAVRDIIRSAFQSAGQRCSALRVLYVQKDIEADLTEMLTGAMETLRIGDPWSISTDIGPLIDAQAHERISAYCAAMAQAGCVLKQLPVPDSGLFIPPTLVSVAGIGDMQAEIFGPVLHLASFAGDAIDQVVEEVNAAGYGLTFGLHTRIDSRVQQCLEQVRAGNLYVNRDQIGAIVGSQPFGGEGLSGTGPKAGGIYYAAKFRRSDVTAAPESLDGSPLDLAVIEAALAKLDVNTWATSTDRVQLLRAALRGSAADATAAAASLDAGPIDLPGPTGESNQFSLHPRGVILCLGPNQDALLAQVVQALAAGCSVLAVTPNACHYLHALRHDNFPLTVVDGIIQAEVIQNLAIDAVAFCGAPRQIAEFRIACADRDGPILPLITELIAPAAYCVERTICIDTTAAGGNATLLSLAER